MKSPLAFFKTVGPALVVAAVVLGPGSITTSTKIGAGFGYSPIWIMLCLLVLLIGAASLAAHLGATLERTLCGELKARLGGWAGWAMGIAFFLIVAGFQSSNNMAVVAGIEPLVGKEFSKFGIIASLVGVNAIIVAILYCSSNLYKQVERIMKAFIFMMVIAFLINLFFAKPSIGGIAKGIIPDFSPFADQKQALTLMGLLATTFIPASAFYQGYLVRERGWGPNDVKAGFKDSVFGMCVIVGLTMIVLLTSAATFFGRVSPDDLGTAGAMSSQLASAFGPFSKWIFCFGFLAGGFSSFLVNAMIGGHVFSDGAGFGSGLKDKPALHATTAALMVGMIVGILSLTTEFDRTSTIVVAQASTIFGGPAVMAGLLFLGVRQAKHGEHKPPTWMLIVVGVGLLVSIGLAIRTGISIAPKIAAMFG